LAEAGILVEDLGHRYAGALRPALSGVSFRVSRGRRLGLLGPNGAGKSTFMRILCALHPPQRGTVRVDGLDVATASLAVRRRLGYLPENVPLPPEPRVREYLRLRAALKGVRDRDAAVQRAAEAVDVASVLGATIGTLSRGTRQRVGLAEALLGEPALLVLDEPTVGLDPNQLADVRQLLRALHWSPTLVFSSHILAEVELLCDEVVVLDHGSVVLQGELAALLSGRGVEVTWVAGAVDTPDWIAAALLRATWPVTRVHPDRDGAVIQCAPDDVPRTSRLLGEAAREAGVVVTGLRPVGGRLEERFAAVTGTRGEARERDRG
jgi:ABC-2 type transport system ATP-binding protein